MGLLGRGRTANLTTVMKHYKNSNTESYESIKLGIDVHAKWYYVARQLDGATPQPVQKMDLEGLLRFVARQKQMARQVHTCYEAVAFGYYLHHRLVALGVTNYVVQPQDWDERGKGVKNDRIDAQALCQRLDRYVRGNRKTFSVVRVPTVLRRNASGPSAASASNWCESGSGCRRWAAACRPCTASM